MYPVLDPVLELNSLERTSVSRPSGDLSSIGTESASRQSSPSKPEQGKGRQNQIKKATASNRASYSLNSKPIAYLVVKQAKQAKEAKHVKQAKPEPHEGKMNPT